MILVGEHDASGLRSCDTEETATGGLGTRAPREARGQLRPTQPAGVGSVWDHGGRGTYLFRLVVTNGSRSSQPEIVVVEATTDEDRLTAPAITPETEDRCGNAL